MNITPCQTYHACMAGQSIVRMPDGKSIFKIYYLSLTERNNPEQYDWKRALLTPAGFEDALKKNPLEGIGFITAFPHIAKIFRFSPHAETVLDVMELQTSTLERINIDRGGGTHEFACYAEAVIAAAEFESWARAKTVEEYLSTRCEIVDLTIADNAKLAKYWEK
jgi:hypothetical protein